MTTNRPFNFDSIQNRNSLTDHVLDISVFNATFDNKHLELYYQPQINLTNGEVVGFEGHLRCRHPELGMRLPSNFIKAAEQAGRIEELTQMVINTGFEFMEKLSSNLSLSLIISPKSFQDSYLINTLNQSCHIFHIEPSRVVLEITDASAIHNERNIENPLNKLKMNGFRLGTDEFEADYLLSPQIDTLPFSELKIERKLIETMVVSSQSRKSIVAAIELANNLGITTVAEGIENNLEAIGLRELGCQVGQGYYFAKPMSQTETLKWLANWNKGINLPM